jgi:ribonuclease HII
MTTQSPTYRAKSRRSSPKERLRELADFDRGFAPPGRLIGIDEVGVGVWAGPLVACAIILRTYDDMEGVDDCKVLNPKQREEAYAKIMVQAKEVELSFIPVKVVDQLGTEKAASKAREEAFHSLRADRAKIVLVDGGAQQSHNFPVFCKSIKKGDSKSLSVAAASIVAKVLLDRYMRDLATSYPGYEWDTNVGYGTEGHIRGIRKLGITPYHRLSFDPIRTAAKLENREQALVKSFRRRARGRQT